MTTLNTIANKENTTLFVIIGAVAGGLWFLVQTVVLPIKEMQINLVQINARLTVYALDYAQVKKDHVDLTEKVIVLQQQVYNIKNNK